MDADNEDRIVVPLPAVLAHGLQMESETATVYMNEQWQDSSGRTHTFVAKAWIHTNIVVWEMRSVFKSMNFPMKKGPYRIIDDEAAMWEDGMSELGLGDLWQLNLSRKQCVARGLTFGEYNHDEACASSASVLLILLRWSVVRRRVAEREHAAGVLTSWLRVAIGHDMGGESLSLMVPVCAQELCREGVPADDDEGGACCHMKGKAAQWARAANSLADQPQRWVIVLQALLRARSQCQCASAWLSLILRRLAARIDEVVPSFVDKSDPLVHAQTNGKRRRIDEDFKRAVSKLSVQRGLAPSGAHWAKAQGSLHVDVARKFDYKTTREYQAAAMLTMRDGKRFSMSIDGSRLGEPAKENLVALLWCDEAQRSAWLAPQVQFGGVRGMGTPAIRWLSRRTFAWGLAFVGGDVFAPLPGAPFYACNRQAVPGKLSSAYAHIHCQTPSKMTLHIEFAAQPKGASAMAARCTFSGFRPKGASGSHGRCTFSVFANAICKVIL